MTRLLFLFFVLSSHFIYAGNFGVTPASTTPTEHHTSPKASASKQHKKGKLNLFKHKRKFHLFKKQAIKKHHIEATGLNLFLSKLVWVFIVLGLYALIVLGIVINITWIWFIALTLLVAFAVIFREVIMPIARDSIEPYSNIAELAIRPYLHYALIGGFIASLIALGLLLSMAWLWILGLILVGVALLSPVIWFIVWLISAANDPHFMKF
jgi:hypothetical protein